MILALIGMIVGALITWWAAWHYYEKASRDLAAEAKELKRLNILMLRAMETAGLAEFARDEAGSINGMVIKGFGAAKAGPATVSGEASVTPSELKKADHMREKP